MAFLAPLFLFALAALAVPIAIHLTHRQRREPVAFPSLMFLRRVEFRTTKRQRIRNRLLFALRALALILLAAAFARPLVSRGDAAAAGTGGGREVVILLDGSFSMRHGDRWARARAAALRTIDGLGAADRATVIRFASRAEALVEPTGDKGALRAAVDAARPGDAAGRYAPAFTLARSTLGRATRPRREVVLVGDLQRTGWLPGDELRLPTGTAFSVVDVGDEAASNVSVSGVEFTRGTSEGREQVTATVRVARVGGGDDSVTVPVAIALDGREVARQDVRVPGSGAVTARLGPFALPAETVRGIVRAGTDALEGDNVRHFTLDRGRSLGVLLVQDPTAPPARTLYLRRAFAIGGNPAFRVDVHREGELRPADLEGRAVVLMDDARAPRGEAARRLGEWVQGGGGLVVVAGDRTRPADWADGASLLPATIGAVTDRLGDRGGRLGALDRGHPLLEPFAAPGSGNFSAPRFFRYRPLTLVEGGTAIARFDDGSVALAERAVGRGRVLLWGSTFDNVWNDLPLQPVFLPLVRQLAQHAAGWDGERAWQVVGEALDVGAVARGGGAPRGATGDSAAAEWVALAPSGEQVRLTSGASSLPLDEAGIWEVRRFGARGTPARLVAVNVDPAESEVARVPQAEVIAAVAPRNADGTLDAGAVTLTAAERESRQSLWWWLLLGAALLLAAEAVLANRLSGRGR